MLKMLLQTRAQGLILLLAATLLLFGSHNSLADQLEFAWDASDGDGEVKSYVICWGPSEGDYPNCEDVGNVLQAIVDVPLDSWIISKAIDTNDNESDPSNFVIYGTDLPIQPASKGSVEIKAIYPDPENLVKNGSFEIDSNQDGKPDDWVIVEPVVLDCQDSIAEKCSSKINSQSDEINNINKQFIDLKKNTTYLLSGWIKVDGIGGQGAQIYVWNIDAPLQAIIVKGTNDWQKFEKEITTGENLNQSRINFRVYGTQGTAWFDDIQLLEKK